MSTHPLAEILTRIPHRHPMLLVDRILALAPGRAGRAQKLVSANETYREGSERGGLPPTLVVDALGQLAIVVLGGGGPSRRWYLAGLENITVGPPAQAGDRVLMEVDVLRRWRDTSKVSVRASVGTLALVTGVIILSAKDKDPAQGAA